MVDDRSPIPSRSLRIQREAADAKAIELSVEGRDLRRDHDQQVIVEIASAAVNPSDVKAAIGLMPTAAWPRTPGRDFAGTIVDGPENLIGVEVWGTSGDLGIIRDGTHASHIVMDVGDVQEKPPSISLLEAGAVGVPFVTAWEGFRRAGFPVTADTVVIMGIHSKVGHAATQLARMWGARVIGVDRRKGSTHAAVEIVDAKTDAVEHVLALTGGKGADIVFNTVGDPYFELAHRSLGTCGRQILISAIHRVVSFDIFEFYRGQHTYVGINTLALDTRSSSAILAKMRWPFARGQLTPFPILTESVHHLEDAHAAYIKVATGARERIVIVP